MQHNATQCNTMQYNAKQYNTMQQYIQYNTTQYKTKSYQTQMQNRSTQNIYTKNITNALNAQINQGAQGAQCFQRPMQSLLPMPNLIKALNTLNTPSAQ